MNCAYLGDTLNVRSPGQSLPVGISIIERCDSPLRVATRRQALTSCGFGLQRCAVPVTELQRGARTSRGSKRAPMGAPKGDLDEAAAPLTGARASGLPEKAPMSLPDCLGSATTKVLSNPSGVALPDFTTKLTTLQSDSGYPPRADGK